MRQEFDPRFAPRDVTSWQEQQTDRGIMLFFAERESNILTIWRRYLDIERQERIDQHIPSGARRTILMRNIDTFLGPLGDIVRYHDAYAHTTYTLSRPNGPDVYRQLRVSEFAQRKELDLRYEYSLPKGQDKHNMSVAHYDENGSLSNLMVITHMITDEDHPNLAQQLFRASGWVPKGFEDRIDIGFTINPDDLKVKYSIPTYSPAADQIDAGQFELGQDFAFGSLIFRIDRTSDQRWVNLIVSRLVADESRSVIPGVPYFKRVSMITTFPAAVSIDEISEIYQIVSDQNNAAWLEAFALAESHYKYN